MAIRVLFFILHDGCSSRVEPGQLRIAWFNSVWLSLVWRTFVQHSLEKFRVVWLITFVISSLAGFELNDRPWFAFTPHPDFPTESYALGISSSATMPVDAVIRVLTGLL